MPFFSKNKLINNIILNLAGVPNRECIIIKKLFFFDKLILKKWEKFKTLHFVV